jgi:hypothetical protein
MLSLAVRSLRHRIGSAVATLVALAAGVMILMSMGTLVESGLRYSPAPDKYAASTVVVGPPRDDLHLQGLRWGDHEVDGAPARSGNRSGGSGRPDPRRHRG